jgi:hypothetical protein
MNAIQEISLKLQMGIDPAADIDPAMLRSMWNDLTEERTRSIHRSRCGHEYLPAKVGHPQIFKSG